MPDVRLISCGELYKVAHGYDRDGGAYDAIEKALRESGWSYDVSTDSWTKAAGTRKQHIASVLAKMKPRSLD